MPTDVDAEQRMAAEAVVLNEYSKLREQTIAALVKIGIAAGDTEEDANDWALECLRYAND